MLNTVSSNHDQSAAVASTAARGGSENPLRFAGQDFVVTGKLVKVASLEDDWYEDVADPAAATDFLKGSAAKADVFTFWQRIPETEPKYAYRKTWESLAVLPIKTYDQWFTKQVARAARNKIRKAQKAGIEVRAAAFDDEFISGMVDIFNESPIRQGRPFWHYGKDFETVKREFARFLFRESLIGAYLEGKLIGFVMLADAGRYAVLGQFVSKMAYRDKATNNLLIAKAVEMSAEKGLPFLIYGTWAESSLVDFKKQSGFEEMKVPRYFVSLTLKGELALKLVGKHVHGELKEMLPDRWKTRLKNLRLRWYNKGMARKVATPVA